MEAHVRTSYSLRTRLKRASIAFIDSDSGFSSASTLFATTMTGICTSLGRCVAHLRSHALHQGHPLREDRVTVLVVLSVHDEDDHVCLSVRNRRRKERISPYPVSSFHLPLPLHVTYKMGSDTRRITENERCQILCIATRNENVFYAVGEILDVFVAIDGVDNRGFPTLGYSVRV